MDEAPDCGEDILRYRLLESLREYSAEQLTIEETTAVNRRHLEWYAGWTDEAHSSWIGTDQQVWLQRAHMEQENVRAALHFSLCDFELESASHGMRIMANLGQYWALRGNLTDARGLLTLFLKHPGTQESYSWRARALLIAGGLAGFQEDWNSASQLFEESLTIARKCDPSRIGSSEIKLGDVAFVSGDLQSARHYYQRALISYAEVRRARWRCSRVWRSRINRHD